MNERIKIARKHMGLNQTDFGKTLGVSKSAVQKWESGENTPVSAVLSLIAQKAKINEIWLRTGAGEPFDNEASREVEMTELFAELMSDRPEAFRTRLVTTLLRFRPDGPEWAILERIYEQIKKEADAMEAKEKETDS